MLYAYLGPDTFLPLTSILATVAGATLMFGRIILQAFRTGLSRLGVKRGRRPAAARGRKAASERSAAAGPHIRPTATRKEPQP